MKIWENPVTAIADVTSSVSVPSSATAFDLYHVESPVTPTPTFTAATPPAVTTTATLGTVAPGTMANTLDVELVSDGTGATGSTIALAGSNVDFTIGTGGTSGFGTIVFQVTESNSAAAVFSNQVNAGGAAPAPTFTPASSPTTSGATVTIGTASPGTALDTLTVTLNSDSVFSSGSTLVLSGASAPYNVDYTPGTITTAGGTTLGFTIDDTTNSTNISPTKSVGLTVAGSGPMIAHSVHADGGGGASRTLPTLTCPANSVIVVMGSVTGDTPSGVSDTQGLTWALRKLENTGFYPVYEYWAATTGAITTDITVAYTGGAGFVDNAVAMSVTGCTSLSAPFDVNGSLPAAGTSAPLSISTTASDTLVIGMFREGSTAIGVAGSGFTLIEPSTFYFMTEYQAFTSPQTSLSVTDGTSGGSIQCIADALY